MTNSVDPGQTDLGLNCLAGPRSAIGRAPDS